MRVLVVEDEKKVAAAVRRGLEAEGFAVDVALTGTDGLWLATEHPYDVIVLDIMLPGMNGYKVCEELRDAGNWTPILMLTAKDGEYDHAEALDTGADDFLTKPFSFVVLLARLRALLRRSGRSRAVVYTAGDLKIDPVTHRCTRGDVEVVLTAREFAVLEFLMRRAGEVVSKAEILDNVWDFAFEGDPNIVEVYVRHLRKKLDEPFGRQLIETIRGAGTGSIPEAADSVRRFATVRVRITASAVLVVGLALAIGGAWLVSAHRDDLTQNVQTAARLRSHDVATTIADGDFPDTLVVPRGEDTRVQVVDANGRVVAASTNLHGDAPISTVEPRAGHDAALTRDQLPGGDGPFRVVARRVTTKAGTFIVYVAGSLERVDESTSSLIHLLLVGLPALLVLVGATTWVVTGRALRPVESMRREVEAIGAEDLHRRVPEPKTADEIGRLAHTMNAMLGRLENATDRQQRFVADASHELRSPLTGIRAQLEVDLAHPEGADWQATERGVLDDTIRMQRLVDDLLTLATADASAFDVSHREPVDLDEVVLQEARRLRSRTHHRIDTTLVSGAQLDANPDQLVRAVRNLLDNAVHHARSLVTVTLGESDTAVVLTVADDGPGIPPDQRARIFERFTRLDDARNRDDGGTGLGLAITREVVTAHGGTIVVDDAPGARFTISLPLPLPSPM